MRKEAANLLKKLALGGALVAVTTGAYAASDGTLGATSTGTIDISLTVNGAVKISNLDDITLPAFSGADVSDTQTACVYSNSTGGGYTLTATATGASFDLSGTGGSIPYAVEYDDGSGYVSLTHGSTANMTGASATDDDCGGSGSNATVQVSVAAADASAVPQGGYTSTLTLVVAPI